MRLIDADALRELIDGGYDLDFSELPETKRELLNMIDYQPTIDTLYGYKIEHLAMIAAVMQRENVSPEKVAETITDVSRIVQLIINEQMEIVRKEMERWLT